VTARAARAALAFRFRFGDLERPIDLALERKLAPFPGEDVAQHHAQPGRIEPPHHLAAHHHRDRRRLLGDDHHEGVGLLGDPDRRPVSGAVVGADVRILGEGKQTAGSDDPLLYRVVMQIANQIHARAMISYTPTGTQLGLALLARRRADMCGIHWGPAEESGKRHPALLKQFSQHHDWVLVRLFRREQGLILAPDSWPAGSRIEDLFSPERRWSARQEGAGSQRFLQEIITRHGVNPAARRITSRAYSERDAASQVAMGQADVATGIRAAATEFGLDFLPIGWEAFDMTMHRGVFFRTLFQKLLEQLRGGEVQSLARMLGGYDLTECGNLVWPA